MQNYVNDLYKGDRHAYKLGTGSTADAARLEIALGIKVFGKDHVGKARQYVRDLRRWLARHRAGGSVSPGDRKVARQLIADMESALAGR